MQSTKADPAALGKRHEDKTKAEEKTEKRRKKSKKNCKKGLTNWKTSVIIYVVNTNGASPSGKATDSDSVIT